MKIKQLISWVFVLLWMGLIVYLSHQPAQESSSLSGGIMDFLIALLPNGLHVNLDLFHTFIRKCAHFGAYFVLAVLTIRAMHSGEFPQKNGLKYFVHAFGICALFAASDEIHQIYIPGRSGEVRDVLLDSFGALTGLVMYRLGGYWVKRRKG